MKTIKWIIDIFKLLIYTNFGVWLYHEAFGHGGWISYNGQLPLTSPEGVETVNIMLSKNLFISGLMVVVIEIASTTIDVVNRSLKASEK